MMCAFAGLAVCGINRVSSRYGQLTACMHVHACRGVHVVVSDNYSQNIMYTVHPNVCGHVYKC